MPTPGSSFQQSLSFFDRANEENRRSILPAQTDPSNPQLAQLGSVTGAIVPDRRPGRRLDHFPEDLYDLRPESHLTRFLKALMGDSGAGQLRKRYLIAQLQAALTSTHFYDLDRFYGALFGAQRRPEELLPVNPFVDTATPDEWDEYHAADATYRERIIALAKAIAMGATRPGIQAAAEAVVGVECDIYETWSFLDAYGPAGLGRAYEDVESDYIDYADMADDTWRTVEGRTQVGRSEGNNRGEVIVRPKKNYNTISDDAEYNYGQQAQDEYQLLKVLTVLKPAGVLITIDNSGVAMHTPAEIGRVFADSEYWEVVSRVQSRSGLRKGQLEPYPVSKDDALLGVVPNDRHVLPRPPFSQYQGETISYASEVVSVRSYALNGNTPLGGIDYEVVTFYDGEQIEYTSDRGIMGMRQSLAAHYASDGVLSAHPYSGERVAVSSAD